MTPLPNMLTLLYWYYARHPGVGGICHVVPHSVPQRTYWRECTYGVYAVWVEWWGVFCPLTSCDSGCDDPDSPHGHDSHWPHSFLLIGTDGVFSPPDCHYDSPGSHQGAHNADLYKYESHEYLNNKVHCCWSEMLIADYGEKNKL